jgi:hypothetical protein
MYVTVEVRFSNHPRAVRNNSGSLAIFAAIRRARSALD